MIKRINLVFILFIVNFITCKKEERLTDEQIVEGLKEALRVATDTAVTKLHKINGYYLDSTVKIHLPPDAENIQKHKDDPLLIETGISNKIENLILQLNRSAENAAIHAKPIFFNAIININIEDAKNILYGYDTAATHYFRLKCYKQLFDLFLPYIKTSLNKPLVNNLSAYETWEQLKEIYNPLCGPITGWKPINSSLDTFTTSKAIDGLFKKIGEQEKIIRKNPQARVTDILKKVFSTLDK